MKNLSKEKIVDILNSGDEKQFITLLEIADEIRRKYVGDMVFVRAIIEFSNFCTCNCAYCGIRAGNKKIQRYRMEIDEIVETALMAFKNGFGTVVLQSGEDSYYNADKIIQIIKGIKSVTNLKITLSIGEREFDELKAFKQTGADRYLIKHETSDADLYAKLHPQGGLKKRLECMKQIKSLGYELGSGAMIGIPGQSVGSIADDILLFNEFDVDMIGIGPYIAHSETPLFKEFSGYNYNIDIFMQKVMALTRIINPKANIPATTAYASVVKNGRINALNAGANVVMLNVTPQKYKAMYEIYPDKICLAAQEPLTLEALRFDLATISRLVQ